jgi:tetratricopeptide (TPR) repeat protein
MIAEDEGNQREAEQKFDAAEQLWEQLEMPWERAEVLHGQGRCLLALGRPTEAAKCLWPAKEILQSLEAAPALAEVEALLKRIPRSDEV